MGLGEFDAARECYESLRTFGENSTADSYLKKLAAAQERDKYFWIQLDPETKLPEMILSSRLTSGF